MRIFVYEYITGGGLIAEADPPSGSLLWEGAAMLRSLATDFALIEGVRVSVMRDARLDVGWALPTSGQAGSPPQDEASMVGGAHPTDIAVATIRDPREEVEVFAELAAEAERTILIAPEIDGALLKRVRKAVHAGGRLLSPSAALVEVASDKHQTSERLAASGVPTPRGVLLEGGASLPEDFPYPAVLKPVDGAGSQDVHLVRRPGDGGDLTRSTAPERLEVFHAGTPASVALLCGPGEPVALPACRQRLSDDGRFRYLGGEAPLEASLCERAQALALRAIGCLPESVGYVGVDLVLGGEPEQDVVIEINPRLTTSYVGIRQFVAGNMAAAMLAVEAGSPAPLPLSGKRVRFDADGSLG